MSTRSFNRRDFLMVTGAATGGFLAACTAITPTPSVAEAEPAVPAEEAAPAQAGPAEGMYFRLVTHGGDDPFWAVVQQGMRDAAELYGCGADIDLAGGDLANQQKKRLTPVMYKKRVEGARGFSSR